MDLLQLYITSKMRYKFKLGVHGQTDNEIDNDSILMLIKFIKSDSAPAS